MKLKYRNEFITQCPLYETDYSYNSSDFDNSSSYYDYYGNYSMSEYSSYETETPENLTCDSITAANSQVCSFLMFELEKYSRSITG